jgi:hypothetical protein
MGNTHEVLPAILALIHPQNVHSIFIRPFIPASLIYHSMFRQLLYPSSTTSTIYPRLSIFHSLSHPLTYLLTHSILILLSSQVVLGRTRFATPRLSQCQLHLHAVTRVTRNETLAVESVVLLLLCRNFH